MLLASKTTVTDVPGTVIAKRRSCFENTIRSILRGEMRRGLLSESLFEMSRCIKRILLRVKGKTRSGFKTFNFWLENPLGAYLPGLLMPEFRHGDHLALTLNVMYIYLCLYKCECTPQHALCSLFRNVKTILPQWIRFTVRRVNFLTVPSLFKYRPYNLLFSPFYIFTAVYMYMTKFLTLFLF